MARAVIVWNSVANAIRRLARQGKWYHGAQHFMPRGQ